MSDEFTDENLSEQDIEDKLVLKKKEIDLISEELDNLIEDYEEVLDMQVTLSAYLGSAQISLFSFLKLTKGSIIDLGKAAGEGANFSFNDCMVGKGEIMVYEKNLAVRINEILSHDAIIYHFYNEIDAE